MIFKKLVFIFKHKRLGQSSVFRKNEKSLNVAEVLVDGLGAEIFLAKVFCILFLEKAVFSHSGLLLKIYSIFQYSQLIIS